MKKKVFPIIILLIIILTITIGMIVFIRQRDNSISLIQDYITIEYGETYNPTLEELINLTEYNYINPQKVKIESNIKNEDNKEFPATGTYQVYVYYKDKILIQTVEFKDTVAPELSIQENVEIEKDTDLSTFDFGDYISIFDLSEMKDYKIEFSGVNTSISGEYIAKISIEDIYGNKSEKEFKIIIPEVTEQKEVKKDTITEKNTDSTSTINSNSNNSKNSSSSLSSTQVNSNTKQESTSNVSKKEEKYWCYEGGSHHVSGNGSNEHGYYDTWDKAFAALQVYMKDMDSGNYKVDECACGLYYFWVVQK